MLQTRGWEFETLPLHILKESMKCNRCGKLAEIAVDDGELNYCSECYDWVVTECRKSDEQLRRSLCNTPWKRFLRFVGLF